VLAVMRLPFVSVSVIPADVQRRAMATVGFWIFDDSRGRAGDADRGHQGHPPERGGLYISMFDRLQREAVRGEAARQLIAAVTRTNGSG
jgi:hypothetical protein